MRDRTIYIQSRCKLSYSNNHLIVVTENEEKKIFLDLLSSIVIESLEVSLTSYLMSELIERNINVVFCDKKKYPSANVVALGGTNNSTSHIKEQCSWNKQDCDIAWKKIVEDKISTQKEMLKMFYGVVDDKQVVVNAGDPNNVEGKFASHYFKKLFGRNFIRHSHDNVNSALNYGYIILLSQMCRIISSHGYLNQIGIHHKGANNNYNLACDLMEPFRPLVDFIVKTNEDKKLTKELKAQLIDIVNYEVFYGGNEYKLKDAMELYFLDTLKTLNDGSISDNKLALA